MKRLKETIKDKLQSLDNKNLKSLKDHLKNARDNSKTSIIEQPVVQPIEQPTEITQ